MKLSKVEDIPKDWKVLTVRKKSAVRIRPCKGVERFKVSWADHDLVSDPEQDIIVISNDNREYPCKLNIFKESYEVCPAIFISEEDGYSTMEKTWVKKATNQIVEIPEGTEPFEVETMEGVVGDVQYPDYVVIGVRGELYVNCREFVEKNLEILN